MTHLFAAAWMAHLGTLDLLHDAVAPPRPVLVLDERLACTWDPYDIRACQNLG